MNKQTLESFCQIIVDCKNRTPPEAPPGEGTAFAVGTPHIVDGRIDLSTARPVTEETFSTWTSRAIPQPGDIILTREAPVGRVAMIKEGMRICLGQRTMLIRTDKNKIDNRFFEFLLKSKKIQQSLYAKASGSTTPHLRVTQVRELEIPNLPSTSRQKNISDTLGALDDKIAVNEQIVDTSLNLAEQIYLKHSYTPEFKAITLESAAKWLSGGTPKTNEQDFWDGDIPWISAKSLKSPFISNSDRNITELGAQSGSRVVDKGTVIFVVRGSSLKNEFRIGVTQRSVAFGQDCKALVANENIDPHTLFHAIRSRRSEILDMVDETAIGAGRLSTDLISKFEIRVPNSPENEISIKLRLLDEKAARVQSESRTLAELRDTLLPQLMSGKLRVKDAESIVEDAT
ncbi:restriction endonuclease subunit S [Salinactinospora qingdaonensis]|uniref:Type I restriction modification DNA specificity domain-containing protein n=1 Tax=Salinactinospora qingdaonensis TaxID=702744 RepID=A0ABP7G5D8_9ACTN